MITERLFMKSDADPVRESSCKTRVFCHRGKCYILCCRICCSKIKKFRSGDDDACIYTAALLHMVGEDTSGTMDKNDSYLEYVKAWTKATDHGGLKHASEDTYKFFLTLENRFYDLIKRGEQKVKVVSETMDDENLNFPWQNATDMSHRRQSSKLLQ